jgi:hypothetical protein
LQKANIRPTDIVGASVLCACVGEVLPWISVSYVVCICVCVLNDVNDAYRAELIAYSVCICGSCVTFFFEPPSAKWYEVKCGTE